MDESAALLPQLSTSSSIAIGAEAKLERSESKSANGFIDYKWRICTVLQAQSELLIRRVRWRFWREREIEEKLQLEKGSQRRRRFSLSLNLAMAFSKGSTAC